jgi:hypothetical protein
MNGWTPIGNDLQTIASTPGPGSCGVIDSVHVSAPAAGNPAARGRTGTARSTSNRRSTADGSTPAGIEGWLRSTFSENGGVAVVSRTAAQQRPARSRPTNCSSPGEGQRCVCGRQAAEARVTQRPRRNSPASKPASRRNRRGTSIPPPPEELAGLMRAASRAERQAKLLRAESDLLTHDVALLGRRGQAGGRCQTRARRSKRQQGVWRLRERLSRPRGPRWPTRQLAETYAPLSDQFPRQSTGRRRALALWITRREHPLTARVAVNHIWTRHFRAPLVASVYDFGRNGARPTHPNCSTGWRSSSWSRAGT